MTVLNDCEFCGRPVVLLKDPESPRVVRAMDPIEYRMTMPAYWTADALGFIRPGGAMLKHQCPAAKMTSYVVFSLAASQRGARVVAAAQARPCPKCSAEPGVECWNLSERRHGNEVHTVNPHSERYEPLEGEEPVPMENPRPIRSDDVEGAVKWATGEIDEEYT